MKSILISGFLLLASCGAKVSTETQDQKIVNSGEGYQYIIVRLEFITQLKELCQDLYIASDYENEALYRQDVAQCTFEKMSLINISVPQVNSFQGQYCQDKADYGDLSPTEIAQIQDLCTTFNAN